MRWRSFALFGIVALLGSAWILWYLRSPDARKAPATVEVKRGEISVRITGLGELRAFESVTISAQREDRITYLVLEEIRQKPLPADLERARLELDRARAVFEMEGKRRSQVPDLVRRGLVSKNAVDEVEVKYLEAKVGLQVAESNLGRVALGADRKS